MKVLILVGLGDIKKWGIKWGLSIGIMGCGLMERRWENECRGLTR